MERHHLLEIILWPNEDGTYTEIRNSAAKLKELGIYYEYKLCINLTKAEHARLHMMGTKRSHQTCKKLSISHTGHKQSAETCLKRSIAMAGHLTSNETRHKLSKSLKGKLKGKHWEVKDGKRVWY